MSKRVGVSQLSDDMLDVVDEQFINQLQVYGFFDHFQTKTPTDDPVVPITSFFSLSDVPKSNLIETNVLRIS